MQRRRLLAILRQWTYPREFRISVGRASDWHDSPVQVSVGVLPEPPPEAEPAPPALDPSVAVDLCNYYFRLLANAKQMEADGRECKELRSMTRQLDRFQETLEDYGVSCTDLTGQVYDDTRVDFEPVGEAEVQAGLDRRRIVRCECPVVMMNGKLLQKARGVVARPA